MCAMPSNPEGGGAILETEIFRRHGWRVTSPYGWRIHPIYGDRRWHRGIDLVKPHQHPIPVWVGGRVKFAGDGQKAIGFGGYGLTVAVQDQRKYLHIYSHLDSIAVKVGETVKRGDVIGRQGMTGLATGSHLHYEMRARSHPDWGWSTDIDPGKYLTTLRQPVPTNLEIQRVVTPVYRGRPLPFDAYLINGTSYVPVRWFAENMGAKVGWGEEQGGTVYIE